MAFAILAPPVIRDLESQNTSVPFAVMVVDGFPMKLKSTLAVDKFVTTKPPWAPPVMLEPDSRAWESSLKMTPGPLLLESQSLEIEIRVEPLEMKTAPEC